MQTITTIGFDIAKSVFQVHGIDAAGEVVVTAADCRSRGVALDNVIPAAGDRISQSALREERLGPHCR